MLGFEAIVRAALLEDVGRGDVTTTATVDEGTRVSAHIVTRGDGVVAGLPVVEMAFGEVDGAISVTSDFRDGDRIASGDVVARVSGPARGVLTAERVALNFLQRLTGVATATARAVKACEGSGVQVVDTRKTTPGLRGLEKYAVRVGGGRNHRMGLDDAVLIKDNHIAVAGGIIPAVELARGAVGPTVKIEVEAACLDQVEEALGAGADIIMLDNMNPEAMKRAVDIIAGRALVEASGGVTPERVGVVAACGVDVISLGYLTHSAPPVDMSMNVVEVTPA